MRVLIVGAEGFIGRHLQTSFSARGIDVCTASSRDGSGIDPETGLLSATFAIPEGTAALVYLSQSPRYREGLAAADHVLAVNVLSAVRAAQAAVRAGVERFVYTSTGNVYRPSFQALGENAPLRRDDWYALTKVHGEEALQLFAEHLDVCVLRLFGVYGPNQPGRLVARLIDRIVAGNPIFIQPHPHDSHDDGGLRISLCAVEDLGDIVARIAEHGARSPLNVASREVLSIRDIGNEIGRQLEISPQFSIAEERRSGNLIADVSLLEDALAPAFCTFRIGLERVLEARRV